MAQVVVMPQLGNTVESCLITTWLVKVGDQVDATTLLAEIETDKSAMEVPSGVDGTVLALLAKEGDEVPVKQPIAVIGQVGEDVDQALAGLGLAGQTTADPVVETPTEPVQVRTPEQIPTSEPTPIQPAVATGGDGAVSPRARGLAASQGIDAGKLAGSGPSWRVIERDVRSAMAAGPGLTPGAKEEASGFVPGDPGTGIGGRVTRGDLAERAGAATQAELGRPSEPADFPGQYADTPLKGVRKVIAERMMNSLATSAQLTYTATAPAAGLMALRKRLKGAADPGLTAITIGDLIDFAAVKTLTKHPLLNAHLENDSLRTFAAVHLGMAVDTPRGLLVPTLRWADSLSLREFSLISKNLAGEAIGGSISPDLLSGATFTVSNLGAFGIESFTPLLNVPQVAILGVDAIFPRATLSAEGESGVEQRIGFSLTADHRVIDGADAARFLKDLCQAVADIDLTVLG